MHYFGFLTAPVNAVRLGACSEQPSQRGQCGEGRHLGHSGFLTGFLLQRRVRMSSPLPTGSRWNQLQACSDARLPHPRGWGRWKP